MDTDAVELAVLQSNSQMQIVNFTMCLTMLVLCLFLLNRARFVEYEDDEEETENKYADLEDIKTDPKAHTLEGFIEILQIINKYPQACMQPEHDEVFLHIEYEKEVSWEDAKRLYELSAFWDDEYDCWKVYVSA